uniref:acetylcholinesterase n=1 Tax=Parastrongyloides trichosuri TaxID=131310 RepID=A0A0N4ZWL3_PARTI
MQGLYPRGFESKYFNDTFGNQSEDCLYLNIWVPRTGSKNTSEGEDPNDDEKKKGVLVFIHGGGLRYGSSSLSMYNGSYLAAKTKLIVVTMNYRLGVFGFAYMSNGKNITGNMGLLDQQLALKWVHENIANFTGDPNNVTLWGQGAGAACAAAHLFSKNSENYFQKLILMSGGITNLLYSERQTIIDTSVRILAQQLNCTSKIKNTTSQSLSHQEVFDCLKNETAHQIVKQSENVTYYTNMSSVKGFNIILNDSVFFNGSVFEKLKTGDMKYYVDVLFGMPNNDGSFFLPILKNSNQFGCTYDDRFNYTDKTCEFNKTTYFDFFKLTSNALHFNASVFNNTIKKQYYVSNDNNTMRQNATKFLTDVLFRCRLIEFARKINIKTHGTYYAYYFNMTSPEHIWPDWMKSTHGDELYYAFGWPIKDFIEIKNKANGNETTASNYSCITDSTNRTTEHSKHCKYKMEKKSSYKMMDIIRNFTNIQGFYRNWEKFTDHFVLFNN